MTSRRCSSAIGLALIVLALATSASTAETVSTSQARDAAAEFLATAPPPASVGATCLIDTGVDETPDTSRVVARISLWDDTIGDTSPTHHGTLVADLLSAPRNDWGMVGIWPAARVVSIRANTSGADAFPLAGYYQAMQSCDGLAGYYGINVILLALGSSAAPSADDAAALADRIASARAHGLNVVVAAGNNNGGSIETPAQIPGAFSVADRARTGRAARSAPSARGCRRPVAASTRSTQSPAGRRRSRGRPPPRP